MNFVTKAVFLATKNISSLIFVTKNIFCCSVKWMKLTRLEMEKIVFHVLSNLSPT